MQSLSQNLTSIKQTTKTPTTKQAFQNKNKKFKP